MSRCVFNPLKIYRGQVSSSLNCFLPNFARSCFSSDGKKIVANTTILVQQGCSIQELPVVVRKLDQDELVALISNKVLEHPEVPSFVIVEEPKIATVIPEEVIKNIEKCLTAHGVCSIIERIYDDDFTIEIAVHALEKILKVENLTNLKVLETNHLFENIINCIMIRGDNDTLLDALDNFKNHIELTTTIEKLANELVLRNSDSKLTIEECCEAITKLASCRQYETLEKFWTGMSEQEKFITDKNIHSVFNILPYLKISRRTVLLVLERKIMNVWSQLPACSVIDILTALEICKISSIRVMQSLSRWLNTNIHAINEGSLEAIIESYTCLSYSDSQIEKSLERYMKAKGVKIKSQTLIVAILNHCNMFRLRNLHILNACSEYFIMNHSRINPAYLKPIICPFGHLDFQPSNSIKFWQTLEIFLEAKFNKINPVDIIDIMLACVYLEKYPLNFINRIFNPYFLDILHSKSRPEAMTAIRNNLKLFDTSLALECRAYDGPLLPRDNSAKSIWHDGRIKRIINRLRDELSAVAGGEDRISKFVILPQLPVNELYIVDVMLHPAGMGNMFNFNILKERNISVAVLIHLPEFYNSTGEFLIGPQSMRIRHLRRFGLKVVTLKHDMLSKLKVHPKELEKYLEERMKAALDAYPKN